MKLKKLTNILQVVSVILCLAIIYILFNFAPRISVQIVADYKQFQQFIYPWLIMFWVEGLPIVLCGLICIKLYENIGNNEIFTRENLRLIRLIDKIVFILVLIVLLANILSIYFYLVYNIGFIILHLAYLLILLIVHLVLKIVIEIMENGVELKEDQDLTV
ncbi:DUF2975 domain-containing protein [Miniphocaeibacter halophilus]|uniref:DUF2975 domain-containing protein n=1 Tax=Miniphocaeibacter halophilus TaxID=2931922 RepID=A0AC61N3I3_9FIRM|nr:DUF2975 domain-containing protein [Miniphocaeibacter halophilus]QQK08951.1 DUF2975 domain-containing protein [Miniphocaeibacter halophilus]